MSSFTFNAPAFEITKSYRDTNGQMFMEGIASTTSVDLTGERMSPEVIAKMATRLVGKPLRDEHQKGWYDKMGEIIQSDVVDHAGGPALWIKARLYDWSSKSKDLFNMLKDNGAKMGLSVAGRINPGGLVKELVASEGRYIPTYKDVEPTEVSVTDHPANLDAFAMAVSKSLDLDNYNPAETRVEKADEDVTGASDKKPKEYSEVAETDFLDPENHKYPADDKHLMPALRYFNHEGQRTAGGYDDEKWASMGNKLAAKLNKLTGDTYKYDPSSEKVVKEEGEVTTKKEVNNDMKTNKGNLVSKTVPQAVKDLAKEWGKDLDAEVKKTKEVVTEVEKGSDSTSSGGSFTVPTLGGSDSTSTDTSGSDASTDSGSDSGSTTTESTGISSDLSSMMSELKSTLSALKDSIAGSGSTGSGSTASGSDSSGSVDDKTSTDKAVDSIGQVESEESDEVSMCRAIDSFVQAATAMKAKLMKTGNKPALDKPEGGLADYSSSDNAKEGGESAAEITSVTSAKKAVPANTKDGANGTQHYSENPGAKPALADQDKESASDYKPSANSQGKGGAVNKALEQALSLMQEMRKSLDKRDAELAKLVEKKEEVPTRKGYALTLEKRFTGHTEVNPSEEDPAMLEKLQKDPEVSFAEYHKFRDYGILPKKYAEKK